MSELREFDYDLLPEKQNIHLFFQSSLFCFIPLQNADCYYTIAFSWLALHYVTWQVQKNAKKTLMQKKKKKKEMLED